MMYTVYCDYTATGEGRTIMVLFTKAYGLDSPEVNAKMRFVELFGEYYGIGADFYEGLKFDFPNADLLLSDRIKQALLGAQDAGNLEYHAHLHFNLS